MTPLRHHKIWFWSWTRLMADKTPAWRVTPTCCHLSDWTLRSGISLPLARLAVRRRPAAGASALAVAMAPSESHSRRGSTAVGGCSSGTLACRRFFPAAFALGFTSDGVSCDFPRRVVGRRGFGLEPGRRRRSDSSGLRAGKTRSYNNCNNSTAPMSLKHPISDAQQTTSFGVTKNKDS